jgi:hypothetical protein
LYATGDGERAEGRGKREEMSKATFISLSLWERGGVRTD